MRKLQNRLFPHIYKPNLVLLAITPAFAKEWSAEQKDVLNSFSKYLAAALQENVKEMMSYWHPKFTGWDYKQKLPMNYDAFQKMEENFFINNKLSKLECDPLEIQVEGNIAILHVSYEETWSDKIGKEISSSGAWTAIMLKRGKKWVFMSSIWIEK